MGVRSPFAQIIDPLVPVLAALWRWGPRGLESTYRGQWPAAQGVS